MERRKEMTLEQYHMTVIERLLSLYRELPLEYSVQVIDAIEDIEEVYYNKCKEVVESGSNRVVSGH